MKTMFKAILFVASTFSLIQINYGEIYLRLAEKCGFYGLKPGQILGIQSQNFNKPTSNREECKWRFVGQRCVLKLSCPCVDIPDAGNNCQADHLTVSDVSSFTNTYCGDNEPVGILNATSHILNVAYRLDGRDQSNGFACFVSCTGKGQRDSPILRTAPITCRGAKEQDPNTRISSIHL